MRSNHTNPAWKCASILILALCGQSGAFAQSAPLSHTASPEVYKVLAENEQFRVVLATWQPGQRDADHSHPPIAVYNISGCKVRVHTANGRIIEGDLPPGRVTLHPAIASHSFENADTKECRTLIVERK